MQVKTFLGKDAASVLAQVKSEMGPDAVILNSRDVSKGSVRLHEIVAGIDRSIAMEQENDEATLFAVPRKPDNGNGNDSNNEAFALPIGWRQWHKDWTSLRDNILALMKPELRLEDLAPRQRLALEYLQREGVDDEIIISLYRSLLDNKEQSILSPLAEIIKVQPWGFKQWKNKVHLIGGPFGIGKTVTALRLGLALKDEKPDAQIAIINTDCDRGHGRLILRHYCELLDMKYYEASNAEEMREALSNCRDADRIMVDLPGLSGQETLQELLARLGLTGKSSLHLVLAPHFSSQHIRGLLAAYEAERCSSIIWTKLDEAFSFGVIANAAAQCALPVSAVSFASGLTDSLLPADASQLWHLLFKHQMPGKQPRHNSNAV